MESNASALAATKLLAIKVNVGYQKVLKLMLQYLQLIKQIINLLKRCVFSTLKRRDMHSHAGNEDSRLR